MLECHSWEAQSFLEEIFGTMSFGNCDFATDSVDCMHLNAQNDASTPDRTLISLVFVLKSRDKNVPQSVSISKGRFSLVPPCETEKVSNSSIIARLFPIFNGIFHSC